MNNHDSVIRPAHYTQGGVECIEAIKASMNTLEYQGYLKGNVLKYVWRWRDKGGVEDLRKAQVYLGWLLDTFEAEPADQPEATADEIANYTPPKF